MKTQMRQGIFESNSSSTHVLCIPKDRKIPAILPKELKVDFDEYGWTCDCRTDTFEYLCTAIYDIGDVDVVDEAMETLSNILAKYGINLIKKDVKTNTTTWRDAPYRYYDIDGYVDHAGELQDFIKDLFNDEEKLMTFLFGDSMIYTGNDNSGTPNCYVEVGDWDYELRSDIAKKYDIYVKGN